MWEQIRANKRKSLMLVLAMALVQMGLGFIIGAALFQNMSGAEQVGAAAATGGLLGLMVAGFIWLVLSLVAYFQGGQILMRASGAHRIEKRDHPQLFNVVEEMTIASGLSKMPAVYIIDDMSLNAFATGRSPDNAAVAVTAGLLGKLNRDQLQGVIAHEMSHVINRDVLFMQMLGIMLGTIVIISDVFLRGMFYSSAGSSRRYRSSSRRSGGGGGPAGAILMILAVLMAVLSPIMAYLIFFAASRRREYLADANAVVLTRYPEGLASALEVISHDTKSLARVNKATAPMFISNPVRKAVGAGAMNTHPPIDERIRILRSMGGNVSYGTYQAAWAKVGGAKAGRLPASALADKKQFAAREAHPDALKKKSQKEQLREAGDLLRKVNQFAFVACACGLRIKLPPDFKRDHVQCPRCHRDIAVPAAQLAAVATVGQQLSGERGLGAVAPQQAAPAAPQVLEFARKGQDWTSFKCACGGTVTLSPSFAADRVTCSSCGREIRIKRASS